MTQPGMQRRDLLRAGVAASALGVLAPVVPLGGSDLLARAATGCTPVFKLDGNGGNPVSEVPLANDTWIMQNFGWDSVNQKMYFTQTKVGSTTGDLWVTQTDLAGNKTGTMALHGFGHGQGFTVEPGADGGAYLWCQYAKQTKVGRFPFVDGAVIDSANASIADRTPSIDSVTNFYPFYDALYDRMWYWFQRGTTGRVVGYAMSDARAGRQGTSDRVAEVHMPEVDTNHPFQGFAVVGGWAYILEGKAPPAGNNDPSQNLPVYLSSWNIDRAASSTPGVNDAAYGQRRFQTTAGSFLMHTEPEGMGLWIVDGKPRLGFGIASIKTTTSPVKRQATVYYKSDFLTYDAGPLSCS